MIGFHLTKQVAPLQTAVETFIFLTSACPCCWPLAIQQGPQLRLHRSLLAAIPLRGCRLGGFSVKRIALTRTGRINCRIRETVSPAPPLRD
jgi:hypothetical protein